MESIAMDLIRWLVSHLDTSAVVGAVALLVLVVSGTAGRMALRVGSVAPSRSGTPRGAIATVGRTVP